MKKILLISLIAVQIISCNKENKLICNVEDPINELEWLNEIVSKAENDTTGNYQGDIYLETHNSNQVIFVDMSMDSGGLAGYWFNCDGSTLSIDKENPPIATKKNKLYTNIKN